MKIQKPEESCVLKALKRTFKYLIYKKVILFTDNDIYKFLTWVPKSHDPKTDKAINKSL